MAFEIRLDIKLHELFCICPMEIKVKIKESSLQETVSPERIYESALLGNRNIIRSQFFRLIALFSELGNFQNFFFLDFG